MLRARLVAAKKEGVRDRIEAAPALFINGRRYVGEFDLQSVVDMLQEEHDRVTGRSIVLLAARQAVRAPPNG